MVEEEAKVEEEKQEEEVPATLPTLDFRVMEDLIQPDVIKPS